MQPKKPPAPVKLIVGMLSSIIGLFEQAEQKLSQKFGRIDYKSQILTFDFTDYYKRELGDNILRKFVSFEQLVSPSALPEIKLFTNHLEENFRIGSLRKINIDPGYIDAAKLILASTKDFWHRIYLRDEIYAEVTLRFRKGSFEPLEWTYPDYRTKEYIEIFNTIRGIYMKQAKLL